MRHTPKALKIILIFIPIALVLIVAIPFFIWGIELAGPNQNYVKHFDDTQVVSAANGTKKELTNTLSSVNFSKNGLILKGSEYLDYCYADNDDTSGPWQKKCEAELVNIYVSKTDAASTMMQLVQTLQQTNWSLSAPDSYTSNCFGFSSNSNKTSPVTSNFNLDYEPNYSVSSIINGCSLNTMLESDGTPGDNEELTAAPFGLVKSPIYSPLTKRIKPDQLINNLGNQGYKSYVILTELKQYFDKKLGTWLIP